MYEAYGEVRRGIFGILSERTQPKEVLKGALEDVFSNGVDSVGLNIESSGALAIRSYGQEPIKVVFRAQPQLRRPRMIIILRPDQDVARTDRSHITITSLTDRKMKIVIEREEPQPLTLTDNELRALQMGIGAMRGNVIAAHDEGYEQGLDEGYLQGSQPHPTNL